MRRQSSQSHCLIPANIFTCCRPGKWAEAAEWSYWVKLWTQGCVGIEISTACFFSHCFYTQYGSYKQIYCIFFLLIENRLSFRNRDERHHRDEMYMWRRLLLLPICTERHSCCRAFSSLSEQEDKMICFSCQTEVNWFVIVPVALFVKNCKYEIS